MSAEKVLAAAVAKSEELGVKVFYKMKFLFCFHNIKIVYEYNSFILSISILINFILLEENGIEVFLVL